MVSHVLASSDIKGCQCLKVVACRHEEFHHHLAYRLPFRVNESFSLPDPKHSPTSLDGSLYCLEGIASQGHQCSGFLLAISQHSDKTKTTPFLFFFFSSFSYDYVGYLIYCSCTLREIGQKGYLEPCARSKTTQCLQSIFVYTALILKRKS